MSENIEHCQFCNKIGVQVIKLHVKYIGLNHESLTSTFLMCNECYESIFGGEAGEALIEKIDKYNALYNLERFYNPDFNTLMHNEDSLYISIKNAININKNM
jgi:hypothetical protein